MSTSSDSNGHVISSNGTNGNHARLSRLRSFAWLLDSSVPLPGGYRIGLDALIGLVPGFGDILGALLSAYIVNEARRLGASRSVLLRMSANVLVESLIGSVPLAGDLFDAAFKANTRNVLLLERYQADPRASRRASRLVVAGFALILAAMAAVILAIPALIIIALVRLLSG